MGAVACGSLVKLHGHWVTSCWPDTPTGVTLHGASLSYRRSNTLGMLSPKPSLRRMSDPFLASTTDMLF